MTHVLCFSGGKDSTALLLWALEGNLPEFTTVFCDTGWEHYITTAYIDLINERLLGGRLVTLKSQKYDGMISLVQVKKRVPSAKARFCTSELKVVPMIDYLKTINDEITVYQGIRAAESKERAGMLPFEWSDDYDAWVSRPLFDWTTEQVFDIHRRHNLDPNPLYTLGAGRVGCFPCVLINHGELKRMMRTMPELWDRIADLEKAANGRSFFKPQYIPDRFCTGFDPKSGKVFPRVEDVKAYITMRHDIDENEEPIACMSIYNLCE